MSFSRYLMILWIVFSCVLMLDTTYWQKTYQPNDLLEMRETFRNVKPFVSKGDSKVNQCYDVDNIFDINNDGISDIMDTIAMKRLILWLDEAFINDGSCDWNFVPFLGQDDATWSEWVCCPEWSICDLNCTWWLSVSDITAFTRYQLWIWEPTEICGIPMCEEQTCEIVLWVDWWPNLSGVENFDTNMYDEFNAEWDIRLWIVIWEQEFINQNNTFSNVFNDVAIFKNFSDEIVLWDIFEEWDIIDDWADPSDLLVTVEMGRIDPLFPVIQTLFGVENNFVWSFKEWVRFNLYQCE